MDEHLTGVDAETEGDLVETTATALELGEGFVDDVIGDQAVIDAKEPMASPFDEADLAPALSGEANVVPVSPGVFGADRWGDRGIFEGADLGQGLGDDPSLEHELVFVGDVLELAAAAFSVQRTERLDSVWRRLENVCDSGFEVVRVDSFHFDLHQFPRRREGDEDHAPVRQPAHGTPAGDHGLDAYGVELIVLRDGLWASSSAFGHPYQGRAR